MGKNINLNVNLSKKNSLKKMIDENKVETKVEEGREKSSSSPRKKSLDFFTEKNEKNENTDDGNNFSK